jgi:hypothetical protein
MPDKIIATKLIHLQHKRDLLNAERSFLADKQAYVRDALKAVNLQMKTMTAK